MERKEVAAKRAAKLHMELLEIGKEVEGMKGSPDLPEMELAFENLKFAMKLSDLEGERRYGRQLCAKVTKYMLDNL